MTLSPTAVENTSLVNFWMIDGSIIAENNSLLKSLVVEGYLEDRIILRNLAALILEDLPVLEIADVTAFFFAWNVWLRGLPELWGLDTRYPCLYVAGGVEIKGVGFESIDNIVL